MWDDFDEAFRTNILLYQKLPKRFINSVWSTLTEKEKVGCLTNNILDPVFIFQLWSSSSSNIRDIICKNQKITLRFIQNHWHEMNQTQKVHCINRGFLNRLPINNLLNYLVDDSLIVRGAAIYSMRVRGYK